MLGKLPLLQGNDVLLLVKDIVSWQSLLLLRQSRRAYMSQTGGLLVDTAAAPARMAAITSSL